ncbi:Uncharacterised protein [Bacillus freudenreichii]|nr:Uncharacterised protein [Bacillus freudenreichii]
MPGNYYGCSQYELEVQRMIYEGGAIFQDYILKEMKKPDSGKKIKEPGP